MKLEENLGIFDEALRVSPELDSQVRSIFKDHGKLSDEITVISEITTKMNIYDIDTLKLIKEKFKRFQDHQNQHEIWETKIMTAPYYSDYGG